MTVPPTTPRPVPLDILRLRSATTAYVSILRDVIPAVEAMGEVGASLMDHLRDGLCVPYTIGSPVGIDEAVRELIEKLGGPK